MGNFGVKIYWVRVGVVCWSCLVCCSFRVSFMLSFGNKIYEAAFYIFTLNFIVDLVHRVCSLYYSNRSNRSFELVRLQLQFERNSSANSLYIYICVSAALVGHFYTYNLTVSG